VTADKNPIEDAVEQALDAFVFAPIGLLFDGPARFPKLVRNGRSQVNNARMLGPFAVQQVRAEVEKRTADLDGPVVDLLRGLGVVPGAPPAAPTAPARKADGSEPAAPAADAAEPVPAATDPTEAAEEPAPKKPAARKATTKKPAPKPAAEEPAATTPAATEAPAGDAEANRAAAQQAAEARTAAADAATPSAEVLPIPDYDSLSASQVVTRLRGLSAGQLDAIRAYETATRGRKTILNRVQQLSKP